MSVPMALSGIRVADISNFLAAPMASMYLGDYGAEVVKVEMPRMGDPMRHTSPFNEAYLYPLHDTRPMTGTGLGFTNANSKYNPHPYGYSYANSYPNVKFGIYDKISKRRCEWRWTN